MIVRYAIAVFNKEGVQNYWIRGSSGYTHEMWKAKTYANEKGAFKAAEKLRCFRPSYNYKVARITVTAEVEGGG